MPDYQPPFTLSPEVATLVAEIGERVGRLSALLEGESALRLRRANRIRTVTGTLAIEGNTLDEARITAILEGRRVLAPPREIQEVHNALAAYEALGDPNPARWDPASERDLLDAHAVMMRGLVEDTGRYRGRGVGVMAGERVLHMAPQADRVPRLMGDLLGWLAGTQAHPLIAGCVFHYEFEFIHPFSDGNGRMGRLWQTLLLARWQPLFANLPVESLVHQHQAAYYRAIGDSTARGDSAPFIGFMLGIIRDALAEAATPQDRPQVTPQVGALLHRLAGPMNREQLQTALGLKDRKSFRQRYLAPALAAGWVEMTVPDKPTSRLQKYRLTAAGEALRARIEAGEQPAVTTDGQQ